MSLQSQIDILALGLCNVHKAIQVKEKYISDIDISSDGVITVTMNDDTTFNGTCVFPEETQHTLSGTISSEANKNNNTLTLTSDTFSINESLSSKNLYFNNGDITKMYVKFENKYYDITDNFNELGDSIADTTNPYIKIDAINTETVSNI